MCFVVSLSLFDCIFFARKFEIILRPIPKFWSPLFGNLLQCLVSSGNETANKLQDVLIQSSKHRYELENNCNLSKEISFIKLFEKWNITGDGDISATHGWNHIKFLMKGGDVRPRNMAICIWKRAG